MSLQKYFPSVAWLLRALTGRLARRIYLTVFLLLLSLTAVARVRSMLMARKFHAVLAGLERVKVNQTTEAELTKIVPYLERGNPYTIEGSEVRWYEVVISNEDDWLMQHLYSSLRRGWPFKVGDMMGYRYFSLRAWVLVRDGKVSSLGYGIMRYPVMPREAGEIFSARSVHGFWISSPAQPYFWVSSTDDESPQYRAVGRGSGPPRIYSSDFSFKWTFDAPAELISHLYRIDLSCFWALRECRSAQEIAPLLWQDWERIKAAARSRLRSSEPCPDRVLAGRVRYLPDADVLLLEVAESHREDVHYEDGEHNEDFNTDYKLIEVIRGPAERYSKKMTLRYRPTIPSPVDGEGQLANPLSLYHHVGDRVLFFTNHHFDSCQVVLATSSALSIVRTTVPAPKLPEDEVPMGIQ